MNHRDIWLSLWSEAHVTFGLSHSEFMSLTPRMFSALRKRRDEESQRQELLFGIVSATIANYSTWKLENRASPADFMPSRFGKRDESEELSFVQLHNAIVNDTTLKQGTTRIG